MGKWEKMEDIRFTNIEKESLKKKIAEDFSIHSNQISDEFLKFFEEFVNSKKQMYGRVDRYVERPLSPPGTLSFLVPKIYYNIDIKKSIYTLIGLLLDLYVTCGVTTVTLTMLGITKQTIGKLDLKNGDVCVYYLSCKKSTNGFQTKQIFDIIYNRTCPYPEFICKHNQQGICHIQFDTLEEIFRRLVDIGAFSRTNEGICKVDL
jgi:hypothetical protein